MSLKEGLVSVECKTCKRCNLELDISFFTRDKSKKDGLFPTCKECNKARDLANKNGLKVCSLCLEAKSPENFRQTGTSKRLSNYCSPCEPIAAANLIKKKALQDSDYYERNRDRLKEQTSWNNIFKRYGLTKEGYEKLLMEQNRTCGICQQACKSGQRLAVDHDHSNGAVRGLLCLSCNMRLGVLEKKDWMQKAEDYLSKYYIRDM